MTTNANSMDSLQAAGSTFPDNSSLPGSGLTEAAIAPVSPLPGLDQPEESAAESLVAAKPAGDQTLTVKRGQSVTRPDAVSIWGTPFAQVDMEMTVDLADQIIRNAKPEYFVTANLNYLMLVEQYPQLAEVNAAAAAVVADGHPIVYRSRLTDMPLPERVAGSDLIVELAKLAEQKGYSIYFLGAAPGIAQKASEELCRRFPKLQVAGCSSPPFRQLTSAEHNEMLRDVRESNADILLVAFGQPKGERWIYDNLNELGVPLSIQLGASFDFLAGNVRRAPKFWQNSGFEWLYRACSDPRRLAPRYAANLWFLVRQIAAEFGFNLGEGSSVVEQTAENPSNPTDSPPEQTRAK